MRLPLEKMKSSSIFEPAQPRSVPSTLGLPLTLLLLPFAQIILGGAHGRARRGVGIKARLGGRDRAALLAHLQKLEPARVALEHPVLAGELFGDARDGA